MMIHFFYGAGHTLVDVTAEVFTKCLYGDRVYIPAGDTGAGIFADPLPGIAKGILVIRQNGEGLVAQFYGPNERIWLSLRDVEIPETRELSDVRPKTGPKRRIVVPPAGAGYADQLSFFHAQLDFTGDFTGGDLNHEYVEQLNTIEFLDPNSKVLELGSNAGRNTMIISCILHDDRNLVTLECNDATVEILRRNKTANGFQFHIEAAALSYRKLMYSQDLELTIPGDELQNGYEWINTITFEEINDKYGIEFDTLVADCEGALYYILEDNVKLLEKITTVILESDYRVADQKWAVEQIFVDYGFVKVKSWSLGQGGTDLPQECRDSFWEVWKR